MIQSVEKIFREYFPIPEERKKTVLLVEDEAIIALSETQRLQRNGFRVISANSSEEAVQIATNDYTVDLVLMDIDLGGEEDGTDAAMQILKIRDVPIVFLSSHTEPEVVEKTEKITSYGYVVKNSGETVLIASIKMAFKLYESHLRLKRSEESLKENQELLKATLRSIGDGVISTDELGNITDMNYVAESLTGWSPNEAVGEPIERVFKIVNAKTRRRIRNSVEPLVPRGKNMGLENEALLLSKTGREHRISESSAPIRSEKGYTVGSVLVFRDISKEYSLLESVKESESKFKAVANAAPVMIWVSGLDKKCNWFNQTWLDFTGRSMSQELGDGWAEGVHPNDLEHCIQIYTSHFEERKPFSMTYRLKNKKGDWRWIQDNGVPITNESGVFAGFIGSCVDITEAKEALETLSKDLHEREYLFKELQHRVKNSMTMISSIIEIEASRTSNPKLESILGSIVNRIQSVGNLYDLLYSSNNSHTVRIDTYIRKITNTLLAAFKESSTGIHLDLDMEELDVDVKSAIPLGLIVNELITNVLKYAFPKNQNGKISIKLFQENSWLHLILSDNGVPFPKGFRTDYSPGLGLQLVHMLVDQLRGNIQWKLNGEKIVSISISLKEDQY
ncbi:PAS domain S-box protein [Leptospira sarikeiensis]|uniref:histidine kinase n=1 Tax=Leptospira sarikeiensis TaxID=2484943 RepID=A0A4R9KAX2_9LEPT|nr:PAS domain S-box protein [Leptospira sarikeiensis]TGL62985.1 response regulator [Leptospira sarikeiensis]